MSHQFKRAGATLIFFTFFLSAIYPSVGFSQFEVKDTNTGAGKSMVFCPPTLRGIKVDTEDPFHLTFVMDNGQSPLSAEEVKTEGLKLIKYFLTSLTLPEEKLWVNLSPTEKERIIPDDFGRTEMGRQLLSEDFLLKKLSASLLHPDAESGKRFWNKVRQANRNQLNGENISTKIMDRIWIMPDKAVVYQDTGLALIGETRLKVMIKEEGPAAPDSEIFRSEILPIIEKEVNEGEDFSPLRQIYHSLILASWYKRMLKESVLSKVFVDQSKVAGAQSEEKDAKQRIYDQYLEMFKRGAYQLIREEEDPATGEMVPYKYFSGGVTLLVGSSGVMKNLPLSDAVGLPSGKYSVLDISAEGYNASSALKTITEKVKTPLGDIPVDFVFDDMAKLDKFDHAQTERDLLKSVINRLIENQSITGEDVLSGKKIAVKDFTHTATHNLYLIIVGDQKRQYVVKICSDGLYANDTENEWKILKVLQTDHLNPRFDIAEPIMKGPVFYLVTKFLDGQNLSEILEKGPLDPLAVADLGSKLAEFASYAHKRKIIVRDINPDNIRFLPDGRVAFWDFNVSLSDDYDWESDPYHLRTSFTTSFNAEDRNVARKDRKRPDVMTDIYAIGMTLLRATVYQVDDHENFDVPAALNAVGDKRLQAIIAKAIGPRESRYQDANDLEKDLEDLAGILKTKTAASSAIIRNEPKVNLPAGILDVPNIMDLFPESRKKFHPDHDGIFSLIVPDRNPFEVDPVKSQGDHVATVDKDTFGRPYYFINFAEYALRALGYNNWPEVEKAFTTKGSARELANNISYSDNVTPKYSAYISMMEHISPRTMGPIHIYIANLGSEANEYAVTVVNKKRPKSDFVIAFQRAYHGRTALSLSITGKAKARRGQYKFLWPWVIFPEIRPGDDESSLYSREKRSLAETWTLLVRGKPSSRGPVNDISEKVIFGEVISGIDKIIERYNDKKLDSAGVIKAIEELKKQLPEELFKQAWQTTAFIAEPFQGEAGIRLASARFFQRLRLLTYLFDVPLIMDEVQSGFFVTGTTWAHEQFNLPIPPDIVTFGKKAQANGIYVNDKYATTESGDIDSTKGGKAEEFIRGVAFERIIQREKLADRAKELGQYALDKLKEMGERHPNWDLEFRGWGVALGVEFPNAAFRDKVFDKAFRKGLIVNKGGLKSIRLFPALDSKTSTIDEAIEILEEAIKDEAVQSKRFSRGPVSLSSKKISSSSAVAEKSGAAIAGSAAADLAPGGIDLREKKLNLDLRGQAGTFVLPASSSAIENIHIDGLIPIINNVTPLQSLPEFFTQRKTISVKS